MRVHAFSGNATQSTWRPSRHPQPKPLSTTAAAGSGDSGDTSGAVAGAAPALASTPAGPPALRQAGAAQAPSAEQAAASSATGSGLDYFKSLLQERRFMCTQCGKCCTGSGEVWVSSEEATRIASHLGIKLQVFYARYCQGYSKYEGWRVLRNKGAERDCIFLGSNNLCSIHDVRPVQCSTYPWWPDLVSPGDWRWEKENICEGFDHAEAPPTDLDAAAEQLRAATFHNARRTMSRKPPKRAAARGGTGGSGSDSDASSAEAAELQGLIKTLRGSGSSPAGGSSGGGSSEA